MKDIDVNRTLNSIEKKSFVEDYNVYSNESLNKNEKVEMLVSKYSSNGATIRVSFADKIFKNGLQIQALKIIMNSRVDKVIKEKAQYIISNV